MKTILLTISRGVLARNILQTDVFDLLKKSGHRIVILTPAYRDERFLKEFSAPNVFFENLIEPSWTRRDRLFVGIQKALVYNSSTAMRDRYGIYNPKEGSMLKYALKKIIFWPLSRLGSLKDVVRWFDARFVKDRYHTALFDRYQPDVVFAASVMDDGDVYVLKQARARRIPTVGAVKSWDNISKMTFRVKTDKILVWGGYSRDEVRRFQRYREDEIVVCGVPQFDFYAGAGSRVLPRGEFCARLGIPPERRIIMFASCGKLTQKDGEVAALIADAIRCGTIENAHLLLRPHFAYKDDEKKFTALDGAANVLIDKEYVRSEIFRDRWDYSRAQIERYTNIIAHATLVIVTGSTVGLDAAAFDKPVINIAFDGTSSVPFAQSIARGYLSEHNNAVLKTGGTWLVRSSVELLTAIQEYFKNPQLHADGRKRLKEYFCHQIDGRAGERMAREILKML